MERKNYLVLVNKENKLPDNWEAKEIIEKWLTLEEYLNKA
jgi:hypothetical protein